MIGVITICIICILILLYLKIMYINPKLENRTTYIYKNDDSNLQTSNDNYSQDTHKLKNIKHIPNSLNYKTYQVKATYIATNRKRTTSIECHKNESLEKLLEDEGFKPPYEITEIPPYPPTEKQLAYAKDVIEDVYSDLNYQDIHCLLDRYQQGDYSEPNPGLVEFADGRCLKFSYYIGKKGLYNLIFYKLENIDKIAFFIFSIYRYLSDDRHANLDTSPLKSYFYNFAEIYINDESFLKSMLRYEGEKLRFFGKMTVKKGNSSMTYIGGSKNTIAYKIVSEYLNKTLNVPFEPTKKVIEY